MAENKKLPTLDQLKMLAERTKIDSASRISELAELIAQGLEDVEHIGVTVTLPAASWSGGAQTITHDSFLADGNYWYLVLGGDAGCSTEYRETGITADNVTVNGQMTFHCEIAPTNDLTVNILRLEVEV